MTMFDLRNVRVRSGEEHREAVDVEIAPVEFGGARYVAVPEKVPAELAVTRASTGWVFELRLAVRLHGPCVRCLGDAVPRRRPARSLGLGARLTRPRAAGQDPLPSRLRRSLPGVRQGPEQRAAHPR